MSPATPPEVLWAQRSSADDPARNIIYLTINVPDLQPGYTLSFPTPSSISFMGTSGAAVSNGVSAGESKTYAIESLELFGELDLEAERKEKVTGKSLQVQLTKKELQEDYWPRLTKDKRVNFVKTDFQRWADQDEQDGAGLDDHFASTDAPPGAGMDMDAMMAQMGGMDGMGGMGGLGGGDSGMDFEKILADMKSRGVGDADDAQDGKESDDSSGEDMPPLEEAAA